MVSQGFRFTKFQHSYNNTKSAREAEEALFEQVLLVLDGGVQQHGGAVQTQLPPGREALGAEHVELVEAPVPVEEHRAPVPQFALGTVAVKERTW